MGAISRCAEVFEQLVTKTMAKGSAVPACLILVAVFGVCNLLQSTFVPPARRSMAAAGVAATLGAAPAFADSIDDAAKKLTDAAYPFLKEVDWNSDIYTKIPGASPSAVLKAVDKALVMGAAMDPAALKAGVLAHHKAIGSVDAKGVTSAADFEAINAALGHMIASVPTSKTMDVYNAFSAIVPKDVPAYLMGTVQAADAQKAYSALLEFKDVVKAAR